MQKKSQRTVDKGLFVPVHIQAHVAQIHWLDLGQALLWLWSLIAPLSLRVQTRCAQNGFLHSFYSRVFRSTSVLTVLYDHVSTEHQGGEGFLKFSEQYNNVCS